MDSLYNFDALLPPGISNIANNCYANSVLHYVLNHPTFVLLLQLVKEDHIQSSCELCLNPGMKRGL